jgi:hypothetical protein
MVRATMITDPGFFCGCNTEYFNKWGKVVGLSARKHAPWAVVHYHVFDGTELDRDWCNAHGFSFSHETTPDDYNQDLEQRRAYWSNMRWVRAQEIFDLATPVISIDADSIIVKDLSKQQFLDDLQQSWVPTAPKREQLSLASAVGYGLDDARTTYANHMRHIRNTSRLAWADDQKLLDKMLDLGQIQPMDLRYTDFKFRDTSYIWTGKGDRKFKVKFNEMLSKYQ